ncbi:MAG: RodZ domain-containing protein [Pseudomonadota bacterium]|nr:RodZ domain-containing protein [Pseudomonadota bacterium]
MEIDDEQQTTVGATLAAGREALGITQTEAADVLNLTQGTIVALEADDYDNLPGWVYASGYIRAYARMLGLDADDLVARSSAMRQESANAVPKTEEATSAAHRRVNKMPIQLTLRQWGYLVFGVLALVVLVSFFDEIPRPEQHQAVAQQPLSETPAAASELAATVKDDLDEALADDAATVATTTEDTEVSGTATLDAVAPMAAQETIETTEIVETIDLAPRDSEELEFVPADGADEEETLAVAAGLDQQLGDPEGLSAAEEPEPTATNLLASSTQESPDLEIANEYQVPYFGEDASGARKLSPEGDQQLRFEFAADCWIEIRDSADNLVYADLGRAGEVRRFVGAGPFALKLGFADGVQVFFDAQEIDLAPFTRNQMARLELGQ